MIGPHQGKELELMLEGKKHLAVFSDAVPDNGIIPEIIIPEKAFAPYVANGTIVRVCKEQYDGKHKIRLVLFTSKGNEWRAHAFLWAVQECKAGERPFDAAHEYFIGRLLAYTEEDIGDFLNQLHANKKKAPVSGGF